MKSAVTISLVPEAKGGPFVFWDGLEDGCRQAAELGYDAVEVFTPSADAVNAKELAKLLDDNSLELAAVGTGAGWVIHKLHLVSPKKEIRTQAKTFIKDIIDFAGSFGAPAIIGSMQGNIGTEINRRTALSWLAEGLNELGSYAKQYKAPLLYEPLNRYETNVLKTQALGADFLTSLETENVLLLCDLFHMNIEEEDMAKALRTCAGKVGHIHFVDSNRQAPGFGHIEYAPIVNALREIDYQGYLSAEALPLPDSRTAAEQMIKALREMELASPAKDK